MNVLDLGRLGYNEAWETQRAVAEQVIAGGPDTLLFVEHPPVLTLGASFKESSLLYPVETYQSKGIEVVRTDRGGDVTYHGPGQLVVYPVFDLRRHGQDLHKWMRDLEQAVIDALAVFGVSGHRFAPHTGVWVADGRSDRPDKKIAAIGVKVRKWVSLHGVALNCDNDLGAFDLIVPCGIAGYGVTSVSVATGHRISPAEAQPTVEQAFRSVFSGAALGPTP